MTRDTIFRQPRHPVPAFEFNEEVAAVFDDMIHRSVPLYSEIIRRQAQLIRRFYRPETRIYDLGCSNGNLGMAVARQFGESLFQMTAVDSSAPMIDRCRRRLSGENARDHIRLVCDDICNVPLENAGIVVINFTLQFLPMDQRDRLVTAVCAALPPGGLFLFSEKIKDARDEVTDLHMEFYHRFKKENGYSDLEISQKRDALENVLIPETTDDHLQRIKRAGFSGMDLWLKWFSFCSWICFK
ncbi:MAG: carboxy-S-adenosyl-L-methionine synthase CmoA [Desulfobacteraceae bacterium]|nr:carboxy-S-adenosyl-L-methionine synthase CmoA [Desulfobacteraceae bacterium]